MDQHNENLKYVLSTITPALLSGKNGELWSTNKKVISTHIDPHKLFGRYIKKLIREWRLGVTQEPQGGAVVAARDIYIAAADEMGDDGGARAEVLTVCQQRTTVTEPSCTMRAAGYTESSRVHSTARARSRPFGLTLRTALRTTGGMKPTSWHI